jgi:hypothetical protein
MTAVLALPSVASPPSELFDVGFEPSPAVFENGELDRFGFDADEQALLTRLAKQLSMDWIGRVLQKIALYLVDDGKRSKLEGAGIRAFVFASAVLPSMHGLTQTELGDMLGLHKQSVGRQVSRLRDLFPGMVWGAMQSEAAREACRQREAAKRVDVDFAEETAFEVAIDFQI